MALAVAFVVQLVLAGAGPDQTAHIRPAVCHSLGVVDYTPAAAGQDTHQAAAHSLVLADDRQAAVAVGRKDWPDAARIAKVAAERAHETAVPGPGVAREQVPEPAGIVVREAVAVAGHVPDEVPGQVQQEAQQAVLMPGVGRVRALAQVASQQQVPDALLALRFLPQPLQLPSWQMKTFQGSKRDYASSRPPLRQHGAGATAQQRHRPVHCGRATEPRLTEPALALQPAEALSLPHRGAEPLVQVLQQPWPQHVVRALTQAPPVSPVPVQNCLRLCPNDHANCRDRLICYSFPDPSSSHQTATSPRRV